MAVAVDEHEVAVLRALAGNAEPALAAIRADELGDEVARRVGEDLGRCALLGDDAALLEDDDVVAEQEGFVDIVGDEHDRLAQFALQPQDLALEFGPHQRVDGTEGLVHEQDVRVDREGARHPDALLLAAGELRRVAIRERRVEPDGLDERHGVSPRLRLRHALQARDGGDVVDHLAVRQQPGLLHDVPDAPAQLHRVGAGDVVAVDEDLSAGRVDHSVDHAQDGGLAAAGRPDEDDELARRDDQAEIVDSKRSVGELLRDSAKFDHL